MIPETRNDRWYYAKDKKKVGPVTLAQLGRLLRGGVLKPTDMVLQEGAPKWRPLAEVVAVKPHIRLAGLLGKRSLAIGAFAAACLVVLTLSSWGLIALFTRSARTATEQAKGPAAAKPKQAGESQRPPKSGDAQVSKDETATAEPEPEFTSVNKELGVPPRLVAQVGHPRNILRLALSDDGRWLATDGGDSTARLWDTENGKEINSFHERGGLSCLALAADGKRLVTGSADKIARLYDAVSGKEIRSFHGHTDSISSVALSVDGKWLATGSKDKTARLWDVASGEQIRVFPGHGPVGTPKFILKGNVLLKGNVPYQTTYYVFVSLSSDAKSIATMSHSQEEYYYGGVGGIDRAMDLRVWDATSGKVVRRFPYPKAALSIALSADGKTVATGSSDKTARLWDVASGKVIMTFTGHTNKVSAVALSRDGKWLATASWDSTARLWDTASGREVHCFGEAAKANYLPRPPAAVAFSGDSKRFARSDPDRVVHLSDVATGKETLPVRGFVEPFLTMGLSEDLKWLATASADKTVRLWNLTTGKVAQSFQESEQPLVMVLTRDMKAVVTTAADKTGAKTWLHRVCLRDITANKEVQRFGGHSWPVSSIAHSRDGNWLAIMLMTQKSGFGKMEATAESAHLWEVASGKKVRSLGGHPGPIRSVIFSGDGKRLATGSADKIGIHLSGGSTATGTTRVWDFDSGKELLCVPDYIPLALSRDGKWLLTAKSDEAAVKNNEAATRLWDVASGMQRFTFKGYSTKAVFSNHGKWLAIGVGTQVHLWDVASGKELQSFAGHFGAISMIAFSEDYKKLVSGSVDGTVRLWEVASGKELCRLINFKKGDWAVVDSHGRYDASNGGDVEGLHWVAGTEVIALKQLKERYYDPGLFAKHLGFNKEPLRDVKAFKDVKLFPDVTIASAKNSTSTKLELELINRGGGIGKVQLFVNGMELLADARGPKFHTKKPKARLTVDLANAPTLRPGQKNKITVVTWNQEGYLSSRGLDFDWEAPGKFDEKSIELHAIVVGVSTYNSDALKLRFAAKDAADFAKALELGGKRLFGADKTHITLLCDGVQAPTRANLEKAFEAARKCRPNDVLVVYLAGHGIALPEQGQEVYCYLTKDARTVNQDAFRDPDVRRQYSLTSTELTEWFKKIPALKQVLILDTCAAGAAAKKLIEHRDVGADQIRAIDRLRDRTGFHVLMGCASDRVSYEASQYSQGLLTYSLLQAMRGAKLREGEFIDVMDLFQYAADQVPQLARNIGGIQKPMIMSPRGASFDIGRLKDDDKKQIPLAQVRPLILRPLLQNADENVLDDDLGLMPLLRKRLIEQGYAPARGAGVQTAVFVDADEMPGAVRPTGKYTVKGKTVQVRVLLRQDGKTVDTVQVEGSRDQMEMLIDRLAAAITAKLKLP